MLIIYYKKQLAETKGRKDNTYLRQEHLNYSLSILVNQCFALLAHDPLSTNCLIDLSNNRLNERHFSVDVSLW